MCLQMQASLLVLCIFDVKGLFRSLTPSHCATHPAPFVLQT